MSARRVQSAVPSKQTTAIIPLSDIRKMQEKITDLKIEDTEKYELHKKSQDRIKNWTNTLKQNKIQKDRTQFERFKKDEEERRRIDQEEAEYIAQVKKNILGKANKQIYEDQERVRQFQSKMLVVDALHEREGQQQIKEIQKIMDKERQKLQYDQMLEIQAEQEMREQIKEEELKRKKRDQQLMLRKQHDIMKDKFIKQLQEERIEGELIKAKAQADLEEEQRQQVLRKQKIKDNQQLLIQGNEILKKQKEVEKQKILEEDKKIEEYAQKKERIMQIRKIRDQQRMEEKQKQRQKLIDVQVERLAKQKIEQDKLLNKNIKEAEIKAEEIEKKKKEQRRKLQSAIDYSHKVKMEVAQEQKLREENENKEFQQYWIQRNKELHQQELDEKAQIRQRQNQLQNYHNQQAEEKKQIKVNNLMKDFDEKDNAQTRLEKQDLEFEQWALKQIEKFKADGKNTDLLMKELKQFKYK